MKHIVLKIFEEKKLERLIILNESTWLLRREKMQVFQDFRYADIKEHFISMQYNFSVLKNCEKNI